MLIRSLVQAFARQLATIETRSLRRSRGTNLGAGSRQSMACIEHLENRALLTVSISNGTVVAPPGQQATMVFTATRTDGLANSLQVGYKTIDGTATANVDYVPQNSSVFFGIGNATATISVPLLTVGGAQSSKTFSVTLTSIVNNPPQFAPAVNSSVNSGALGLAIGDLNGDGKPDMVVGSNTAGSLSILLNNTPAGSQSPTFAAKQSLTLSRPASVAIADFNGDGIPDIVTGGAYSPNLSVFLNKTPANSSTISFLTPASFPAGGGAASGIVAVDMNGDGKPDIVEFNGKINVLINTTVAGAATPTFAPVQSFTGISTMSSLTIGDFNGDGKPDIAVASRYGQQAAVFLNTTPIGSPNVTLAAPNLLTVGNRVFSLAAGDVNGDGTADLVVASNNDSTVAVFPNNTLSGANSTTFASPVIFPTSVRPQAVMVGDVTGDGRPDIIVTNVYASLDKTISVFKNTTPIGAPTPSFGQAVDFITGTAPTAIAGANFNSDNQLDLAVVNSQDANVSILINQVEQIGTATGVGTIGASPILSSIESTALNYIENATTPITSSIVVSQSGGTLLTQAMVKITGNYKIGQDQLLFTNTAKLTGSFDAATGTMTITGLASAAVYQVALQSVSYYNLQDNPAPLSRIVTFQAGSPQLGNLVSRAISITPVNDPPLVIVDTGALNYLRLSTTPISPGLLVSDPDNPTLTSATVQITGNYQPIEDRLIFQNTAKIKGAWDASTGTLTLTGVDTGSNYRTALRSVSFYDIQAVPNTLPRTVSFSASDGTLSSLIATRDINVIRQNNPPLLSAIETTPLAYTQDAPAVAVTSTILVSDPDNATLPLAIVQISGGYQQSTDLLTFVDTPTIKGSWDASSGQLTLSGDDTGTNYRAALRSVLFSSSDLIPGPQTRTITFLTYDGTDISNVVTRQITINPVPTLTGIETTQLNYTVPNAKVQITSNIQIKLYDAGSPTGAAVHILNVQSGDLLSVTTIPGILANWDGSTGTLTFTGTSSIANYETMLRAVKFSNPSSSPGSLNRQISFQVFEGALGSNLQSRNLNFSAANNSPPVVSAIETTAATYKANSPAIIISSTINVFDADNVNLTGAVVQISFNYIVGQDVLKFVDTPTIKGVWTPGTARLTLTGTDTVANYQAALRSITYINTAPVPSIVTRTISFTVTDGADPDNFDGNTISRKINVTL